MGSQNHNKKLHIVYIRILFHIIDILHCRGTLHYSNILFVLCYRMCIRSQCLILSFLSFFQDNDVRIIIGQFDENLASKVFCCVSPQPTITTNFYVSTLPMLSISVLPAFTAFFLKCNWCIAAMTQNWNTM